MSNLKNYNLICGLEVHAELKTKSKMFCGCKNDPFGAEAPNSYTCPTCLGLPGALPVANRTAIEWTIKTGLALGCKINLFSKFDRKHYFYPDLPKGYQISQYDIPFCYEGKLETRDGTIRIHRLHLEEDTGKLQHTKVRGKKVSLVDFNRSGVPLMEIVTEPDVVSATQAKEYGRKLRQILRFLDVADCDMQEGGMRLEANISLQKKDASKLPDYKVEVKNINSFRFMEQAIEYEIERQAEILDSGDTPVQETRGWNSEQNKTFSQRSKESAEDYRYFPDPDLPPIRYTKEEIEALRKTIPELPDQTLARWNKDFKVETRYAEILTQEKDVTEWAEKLFTAAKKAKISINDIAKALVNKKIDWYISDSISSVLKAYQASVATDEVAPNEMEAAITQVMQENPDAVEKYRAGEKKVIAFFIGQTMRILQKKVDAGVLRTTIDRLLSA